MTNPCLLIARLNLVKMTTKARLLLVIALVSLAQCTADATANQDATTEGSEEDETTIANVTTATIAQSTTTLEAPAITTDDSDDEETTATQVT